MTETLGNIYEVMIDLPAVVMIGALGVAFLLAVGGTGIYALGRGRVADRPTLVCGLMLVVSVVSMVLAAGLTRSQFPGAGTRGDLVVGPGTVRYPGRIIIHAADGDGDGRLTPREAAAFVRMADGSHKGWADFFDIDHASKSGAHDRPKGRLPEVPDHAIACEGPLPPTPVVCYPPAGGGTGHSPPPVRFPRFHVAMNGD